MGSANGLMCTKPNWCAEIPPTPKFPLLSLKKIPQVRAILIKFQVSSFSLHTQWNYDENEIEFLKRKVFAPVWKRKLNRGESFFSDGSSRVCQRCRHSAAFDLEKVSLKFASFLANVSAKKAGFVQEEGSPLTRKSRKI